MSLRRRGYLSEAKYDRDRRIRDIAEDFYDHLYRFLETRSDELVPRRDGGFSVHAMEFWRRNPLARNLGVVFTPSQMALGGQLTGGIGKAGKADVLVFPIMRGPGDSAHLDTRLQRSHVVHEMIHLLDPGYSKMSGAARRGQITRKTYFNLPGEWNAFWQEGAAQAERLIRNPVFVRRPEARVQFFGDGSLSAFRKGVEKIWDKAFLENMSAKTARKFDKRLAQLWKQFKKEKLL